MGDTKHVQTRIYGLAALGLLRNARSEKMIMDAMGDPDVDVRTAAVLAAGETKDRNLTTQLCATCWTTRSRRWILRRP